MSLQVWLPFTWNINNQGLLQENPTISLSTITLTSGKFGNALQFNGTSTYVTGNIYTTATMTYMCWVYFDTLRGCHLLDCRTPAGVGYQPMYINPTSGVQVGGSTSTFSYIAYTFTAATWYHIAVTYSATKCQLFINGTLVGESTGARGTAINANQPYYIGCRCTQVNWFHGRINDFRIYDHTCSAKEIEEVARGLAIHYKLDKLNGTKIVDCSGFKNHGTATNITIANSSSRYTASSQLPQSASAIQVGNFSTVVSNGNFTFNVWFKKVTGEWSSKSWETVLGGPSGFELEGKIRATTYNYIHPYSWGGGGTDTPNSYSFEYSLDKWHMLTMTRTASATKFYLDGVLKVTGTAGSIPSGNYFLGSWRDTTSQNYRGYLSDARVYVTILTDKQILELYNESAAIARDGTTFAREFVEATL